MPPKPRDDGGYDSAEIDDDTIADIAARHGLTDGDGEAEGTDPADRPD
jgi:hypothetical protein